MKKILKYSQQIIVAVLLTGVLVGVALAAPNFDFTTLTQGFMRNHFHNVTYHGMNYFYYGYGWSGENQEWGYGYGYDESYGPGYNIDQDLVAQYGFEGTEGPATVSSIVVTQTTATITFSTSYLAKASRSYGLINPVIPMNALGSVPESNFNSGERMWSFTDLTCDTTYYYVINTEDVHGNEWPLAASLTTDSCDTHNSTTVGGRAPGFTSKIVVQNRLGLRIPIPFLRFGSVGQGVQDLQILLNHFGTFLASSGAGAPGSETMTFGQRTKTALMKFQSTFGLGADGVYGQKTHDVMERFLK